MWLNYTTHGKSLSPHPKPLSKEEMPVWKIRLPFTSTRAISNSSLQARALITYSSSCTVFWQPLLRMISPKRPPFTFHLLYCFFSQKSVFASVGDQMFNSRTVSSKGEKKPQWSVIFSCPHFAGDTPGISSPPPCWCDDRPLPFPVASLGAVLSPLSGPTWILHADRWSMTLHIPQAVPSQQVQLSVSLPVLMGGKDLAPHY